MAPSPDDIPPPAPNQKTLHLWTKPADPKDAPLSPNEQPGSGPATPSQRPTVTEVVSSIKKEDFVNVASTPCARQGFLTGIATGSGLGGLKFVLHGNATKAANWAVGFFLLGSIVSYEFCQYQRRSERIQMKRHIEVVAEHKREQARKDMEMRQQQESLEQERRRTERSWYKFW